jgi:uncharacterized ParB-like nuclease family protein
MILCGLEYVQVRSGDHDESVTKLVSRACSLSICDGAATQKRIAMLEIKSTGTSEEFDFTVIEYSRRSDRGQRQLINWAKCKSSPHTCSMAEVSGASALLKPKSLLEN